MAGVRQASSSDTAYPVIPAEVTRLPFQIIVEPWVQNDIAGPIRDKITYYTAVIPASVSRIKISYDSEIGTSCEMRFHDEYRQATLVIGNEWASTSEEMRWHAILHELCHLYTTPIARRGKQAVDHLCKDESPENKMAYDAITLAMEACTEDLALTFKALFEKASRGAFSCCDFEYLATYPNAEYATINGHD